MISSKIKTPRGRAVEIRNVELLLLLLSPIVHAGSPTMFTGVELVRSNLPWARGGGGAYAICTPVAIFIIINIGSASAPRGAPHFEKFTMTLLSRRTNLIVLLLACVLTSASWMSLAQPPSAEKDVALLVQQYCSACHGLRGDDTAGPHFPYLASQQYDYLVKQLKNFQSGDRNNPIMATFAALVPPEDIPTLAAYFSKQPLARAAKRYSRTAAAGAPCRDAGFATVRMAKDATGRFRASPASVPTISPTSCAASKRRSATMIPVRSCARSRPA